MTSLSILGAADGALSTHQVAAERGYRSAGGSIAIMGSRSRASGRAVSA